MCTYNINGEKFQTNCDGCDDEEPGATKSIIQAMKNSGMENRVFFIARYCGHEKLSAKRFECYLAAAKIALEKNPLNNILKIQQKFQASESKQKKDSTLMRKPTEKEPVNKPGGPKPQKMDHSHSIKYRGGSRHTRGNGRGSGRGAGYYQHRGNTYKKRRLSSPGPRRSYHYAPPEQDEWHNSSQEEDWDNSNPGAWSTNYPNQKEGQNSEYSNG